MANLFPPSGRHLSAATAGGGLRQHRLNRQLADIRDRTIVEIAEVQARAIVQGEVLESIDYLAERAMTGQAMLHRWSAALSSGDPFIADDVRIFAEVAKIGKAQVIADAVAVFSRMSRF